ncbi:MAG: DUF4145 domain-containing protein [Bacteroidaceae bacterium]|nr:DUF4145 domain-containing protein [Bacteroidaceae bacterium]
MRKNYIEPKKELIKYTCPHCNTISQMEKDWHRFQSDINGSLERKTIRNQLTIHKCQCCGKKIIWIDNDYVYPDIVAEVACPDMPESVKQLYNEAGLIYNKSPRAACALLRLAIDRLCNELGETDRDINKNIGALVKKGLPQSVQQALDVVRVVGNKAVHPGQISFDVDDKSTAIMLMRLLNIIVERMITEPNEIDSLYQGLPESVKESIEKRDK